MGGYYGGAAVDTSRNVLVVTGDGKTLYAYALAQAGAPLTTRMASSPVALALGAPGFEYSPALDRFVAAARSFAQRSASRRSLARGGAQLGQPSEAANAPSDPRAARGSILSWRR